MTNEVLTSTKLDLFAKYYNTVQRLQQRLPNGKDGFDLEYEELTRHDYVLKETPGEFYTAKLPHNVLKNRYEDVLANESTRCQVVGVPAEQDYINANFVDPAGTPTSYICSQAPLPSTFVDFWNVVWYYGSRIILMLCSEVEHGTPKCDRYWPQRTGMVEKYGDFKVINAGEENHGDFLVRTLEVTNALNNEVRKLAHYHYLNWPDFGVPASAAGMIEMLKSVDKVNSHYPEEDGRFPPVVCHCSAGIGRTGTLIAVHTALTRFASGLDTNVFEVVRQLKEERSGMVQRKEQYAFIYMAVLQELQRWVSSASSVEKGANPQPANGRAAAPSMPPSNAAAHLLNPSATAAPTAPPSAPIPGSVVSPFHPMATGHSTMPPGLTAPGASVSNGASAAAVFNSTTAAQPPGFPAMPTGASPLVQPPPGILNGSPAYPPTSRIPAPGPSGRQASSAPSSSSSSSSSLLNNKAAGGALPGAGALNGVPSAPPGMSAYSTSLGRPNVPIPPIPPSSPLAYTPSYPPAMPMGNAHPHPMMPPGSMMGPGYKSPWGPMAPLPPRLGNPHLPPSMEEYIMGADEEPLRRGHSWNEFPRAAGSRSKSASPLNGRQPRAVSPSAVRRRQTPSRPNSFDEYHDDLLPHPQRGKPGSAGPRDIAPLREEPRGLFQPRSPYEYTDPPHARSMHR
eukprot:GGOE01008105.1.p1 GENE.GGOE01008105.1~~GGOE01008105.1.p1  ORF type:complete len:697 (-),score=88.18 GGOE01008105.1:670-2706(-)